jgi:hypothetical protein
MSDTHEDQTLLASQPRGNLYSQPSQKTFLGGWLMGFPQLSGTGLGCSKFSFPSASAFPRAHQHVQKQKEQENFA